MRYTMSLLLRFDRRNWSCKTQPFVTSQIAKAQFFDELRLVFSDRTLFAYCTKCRLRASRHRSVQNTSGQMTGIILAILSF